MARPWQARRFGCWTPVRRLRGEVRCPALRRVRVVHGIDVPALDDAGFTPESQNFAAESRETQNIPPESQNIAMRPHGDRQGSPPTEWCRLPYGVAPRQSSNYYTPPPGLRRYASVTRANPNSEPRYLPLGEPVRTRFAAESRRPRPTSSQRGSRRDSRHRRVTRSLVRNIPCTIRPTSDPAEAEASPHPRASPSVPTSEP